MKKAEIKIGEIYAVSNRRDGYWYKSGKVVKFGDQPYNNKQVLVVFERKRDYLSDAEKILYDGGERFFESKGQYVNYSAIRGLLDEWKKKLEDDGKAQAERIQREREAYKVKEEERKVLIEKVKNSKLGPIVGFQSQYSSKWDLSNYQMEQILALIEEVA